MTIEFPQSVVSKGMRFGTSSAENACIFIVVLVPFYSKHKSYIVKGKTRCRVFQFCSRSRSPACTRSPTLSSSQIGKILSLGNRGARCAVPSCTCPMLFVSDHRLQAIKSLSHRHGFHAVRYIQIRTFQSLLKM